MPGAIARASASAMPGAMLSARRASTAASRPRPPTHATMTVEPDSAGFAERLALGRRRRSIGQLGSQSDMTRRIACLQNPLGGNAAAAARELDVPDEPANAGLAVDGSARQRRA